MTAIFFVCKKFVSCVQGAKTQLAVAEVASTPTCIFYPQNLCVTPIGRKKCKRLHILLQHDGIFVGKRVVSCIRNDEKRNSLLPTLLKTNCNLYRQNPLPLRIGAEKCKRLSLDCAKFGTSLRRCRLIDAPIIFWHIAAAPKDRFCRKTAERCTNLTSPRLRAERCDLLIGQTAIYCFLLLSE